MENKHGWKQGGSKYRYQTCMPKRGGVVPRGKNWEFRRVPGTDEGGVSFQNEATKEYLIL